MSLANALRSLDSIVLGKEGAVRLALSCLLARGHLLIEDVPGVGKTTLAHALAHVLGLSWQRVQFTSDLLPADIIGTSVFDRTTQAFRFRPGPVFTQLLLADEVNRASPRTQGALLEAMEERQVSVDGTTHPLPEPFFVVATQNPREQLGTFPLPESQLDRFLMRIELGYPAPAFERKLLLETARRAERLPGEPALSAAELASLQQRVAQVYVGAPILDYVQALIAATRARSDLRAGLSPRAGQALVRAARAWAAIDGRELVVPEDVRAVLPAVAGHRLERRDAGAGHAGREDVVTELLRGVPVPG